jgi:PiT family inorganic phosphate transporter
MDAFLLMFILLGLALFFDFLNGFHDSANVVATIISSRAMSPRGALAMAAIAEFAGPFIFGVAVATTIGNEVVHPETINIQVVMAALLSASLWNLLTWLLGLPSSSSHALIGGLVGAVVVSSGLSAIQAAGLIKVVAALFLSPLVGFIVGAIIMYLLIWLTKDATPAANIFFKFGQMPTALALALSHGANDAQKTMGIITMGLVILGFQSHFYVPWWVVLLSASAIALGTALGGWRIIRTLGAKFYRVRPIHSFASQLSSAAVILTSSLLGGPVSTTQVVSSSILGVGAAQRISQVRWNILYEIFLAWFLTIPLTAGLAALLYLAIKLLIP